MSCRCQLRRTALSLLTGCSWLCFQATVLPRVSQGPWGLPGFL